MKISKIAMTAFAAAMIAAAIVSCKKDDDDTETLPSLSGSLRFEVKEYLGKKATVTIEPTGVIHPEGYGIGYSCSASWLEEDIVLKEEGSSSFIEENKTLTLPDEIGTYTISCTASAAGYYSTTSTRYVTVVDPVESLIDIKLGYDAETYEKGKGVADRDGNEYGTVIIDGYEWMTSNLAYKGKDLKTAGTISDSLGIAYANCDAMSKIFGRYYTWNEISNPEYDICPDGWEIPDAEAWINLANALSGNDEAGYTDGYAVFDGIAGKMMVDAKFNSAENSMWEYERWMNPEFDDFHTGLSGVSGLSVIPCGFASISSYPVYDTSKPGQEPVYIKTGSFDSAYEFAAFWTANTTSDNTAAGTTEDSGVKPYYRYIHKSDNKLQINTASDTSFGAPIRCVKAVGNGQTE